MLTINLKQLNKHLLITSLFLICCFFTFGQVKTRSCASHYWDSLQLTQNTEYSNHRKNLESKLQNYISRKKKTGSTNTIYQIPVVVHIIHNNANNDIGGSNNSNISDAQVFSQIEVLTEDFRRQNSDTSNTSTIFQGIAADTYIEFCLASVDPEGNYTTGITRHFSEHLPYNANSFSDNDQIKSTEYWPADQYLNIWVTELSDDILGYATFPSDVPIDGLQNYYTDLTDDGIVLDHRVFGRQTGTANSLNYDQGRTTTHEVGHWLGLFHIWGDSDNCFATDFCNDTPSQRTSTTGCQENQTSCTSRDMSENYMDYTYDGCMNMFTTDQKDRMRAVMETSQRRSSLLNSLGCCTQEKTASLPFFEGFENSFDTVNTWNILTDDFAITNTFAIEESSIALFTNSPFPDTAILTTPMINLTELEAPYLSFKGLLNSNSSNLKLRISYSLTCTEIWNTIEELPASNFSNATWTDFNIDLNSISTLQAVRLRFECISLDGSTLYIDNINFHEEKADLEVSAFPNPSEAIFNLNILYSGNFPQTVEVFTIYGVPITNFSFAESYSSIQAIDLSEFPSGIYIVRITVNGQSDTLKITLAK